MKKFNLKKYIGKDCCIIVGWDDLNKAIDIINEVLENKVELDVANATGLTEDKDNNVKSFMLQFGCVQEDYRQICNQLIGSKIDFRVELEDAFGQVFYKRLVS